MRPSTDSEWLAWISLQAHALKLMTTERQREAHSEVSSFLELHLADDTRADALAFRAVISTEQGEIELAKADLLKARSIVTAGSYKKYTIELALGGLSEEAGDSMEAASWYLEALNTVVKDPTTSGGSALVSLLTLKQHASLDPDQQEVCERVARQAWSLFQMPGEPDLTDLGKTARALVQASARPLPRSDVSDS